MGRWCLDDSKCHGLETLLEMAWKGLNQFQDDETMSQFSKVSIGSHGGKSLRSPAARVTIMGF